MSVQALSWAMAQTTGSGTRKAVLLSLANCHNHHTGRCHPSVKRIAREIEVSERTVRRAIVDLEESGFIVRHEQRRPDGSQSVNHFTLQGADLTPPPDRVTGAPPDTVSPLEPEVDLEPSEVSKDTSAEAPDSAKKTPLDLLWDACDEYVQRAPTPNSHRKAYAKLVREMFAAGWTPDMVQDRARAYRKSSLTGEWPLTLAALAKWGEEVANGKHPVAERVREPEPELELLPAEENARRMRELAALVAGDAIGVPSPASSALPHALEAGGPPPMPSPGPPAPKP